MAEPLGEGQVLIVPDASGFLAALQAQVTPALAAIEKQFAAVGSGAIAGGAGLGGVSAEAGAAANVINQKTIPAVKGINKEMEGTAKAASGAVGGVQGLNKQFSVLTKLVPVVIAAFSVKLFGDFEKAAKEAATVFGDSSAEIITFADNISAQFGLTSTAALRFTVDFGNALQGVGFSTKTAAAASEELTKRAADTAAALAKSPQQIATAFTLAIEGNARGLKQLGITISAVDQQNRAAALGFHGTISELTDAQRAAVFYSLVLEKTAKFQGQAAETADTFAGRLRTFKATIGDAAIAIGRGLAPAVEGLLGLFTPLVGLIGKIPAPLLAFAAAAGITTVALNILSGSAIAKFVTGMFAAEGAVGVFTAELAAADGVLATTGVLFETLLGPVGLVAIGVGAVAAAFALFGNKTESTASRLKNLGDAAGDAAAKFKTLTTIDIGQFATDLKALSDVGAVDLGGKILTGDVAQLKGLDLNKILADAKAVKKAFDDLLNQKATGDAGIGAARDALDALNAAGLGNTETVRAMQAAYNKEVASRIAANDAAKKGADILNQDAILREKNAAQIKAQTDAINDLFTVTDQLGKANRTLSQANDDAAVAQDKLNKLRLEGGKQEIADARIKLGDATDSLTASLLRQAEAQKALDKLNAPATDQELADAADKVTMAQIGVRDAIRARDAAERALHKTVGVSVNLAGLDLRQLNTALANARATLAAQRTSAEAKTPQQLQDELATAQIGVNKAVEDQKTAEDELTALKQKGLVKTDEILHQEREVVLAKNAAQKAQEQVNKTQRELDSILAGNSEFAKQLASAQDAVQTATGKVKDAQQTVSDLVAKQRDDTHLIAGDQQIITNEMKEQVKQQAALFAQQPELRRSLVENLLSGLGSQTFGPLGGPTTVPLTPNLLTPNEIDKIFAALQGDPGKLRDLLKSLGILVPGFARGGTVTSPTLAWIGEKFRPESVIPWDRPDRVWDIMAKNLPNMPTVVRQRLEPVIPGRPTVSAATHLNRPVAEFDYDRMAKAIARELRAEGVGADIDIHVAPTPGMSESRLARKVKHELDRYREMP